MNIRWTVSSKTEAAKEAAKELWKKLGGEMFEIPFCSPDINLIEKISHIVRNSIKENTKKTAIER